MRSSPYESANIDNIIDYCKNDSTLSMNTIKIVQDYIIDVYSGNNHPLWLQLKSEALVEIEKIITEALVLKARTPGISLACAFNLPHPKTNITMIEYALAAGLNYLAKQLSLIGVKTSKPNAIYNAIKDKIVGDYSIIDLTINEIKSCEKIKLNHTEQSDNKNSGWFKFGKKSSTNTQTSEKELIAGLLDAVSAEFIRFEIENESLTNHNKYTEYKQPEVLFSTHVTDRVNIELEMKMQEKKGLDVSSKPDYRAKL